MYLIDRIYGNSLSINPNDIEIGNNGVYTQVKDWLLVANNTPSGTPVVSMWLYYNNDENYNRGDVVRACSGLTVCFTTNNAFITDLRFRFEPDGTQRQSRQLITVTPEGVIRPEGPSVPFIISDVSGDLECENTTVTIYGYPDDPLGLGEYVWTYSRLRSANFQVSGFDGSVDTAIDGYITPYGFGNNFSGGSGSNQEVFGSVTARIQIKLNYESETYLRTYIYVLANNPDDTSQWNTLNNFAAIAVTGNQAGAASPCLPVVVNGVTLGGGETINRSFLAVYPPYQSQLATEYLYIATNKRVFQCPLTNNNPGILTASLYYEIPTSLQNLSGRAMGVFDDYKNMYFYATQDVTSNNTVIRVNPDPSSSADYITLPFEGDDYTGYQDNTTDVRIIIYSNWNALLLTNRRAVSASPSSTEPFKGIIGFRGGYRFNYFDPNTGDEIASNRDFANNQYIVDTTNRNATQKVEYVRDFDVYPKYAVVIPPYLKPNTPNDILLRFVTDEIRPGPTDKYRFVCSSTALGNEFCNNCTYNKSSFLSGTFPVTLAYSTFSQNLYCALQNNTITRIGIDGTVDNSYIVDSSIRILKQWY